MITSDFDTITDLQQDGGKGHNLKQLRAHGFNVPDGIVIPASVYRSIAPNPPEFDLNNADRLEAQCLAMRNIVRETRLPQDIGNTIMHTLAQFGETARYTVRSSSTFEDLATAAFAGQHETILNVDLDSVPNAIIRCYESLWTPHAVRYRAHHGFSQAETAMAVVVQIMLDPTASGVAFSADPVGGELHHVLLEANYGIGESVVGGEAVTDSWLVDAATSTILERRIHSKERCTILTADGVADAAVNETLRDAPCLSDAQILLLTETVKNIEESFRTPQDVEWAFANGQLFILQSRPQTRIPPRFTRAESAERFPEPLTPLTWSYVEEAFNISLEHSLRLMGITLPTRPWFALFGNYVYGNQNAVELLGLCRPADMSSLDRLHEQFPELMERFQWVMDLPGQWLRDLDRYLIRMGRLEAADLHAFDFRDFRQHFNELFSTACDYFKPNIAISMTQSFLTRTLFEYCLLVSEEPFAAQALLKGLIADSGTKTGQINREIFQLATLARKTPPLLGILDGKHDFSMERLRAYPEFTGKMTAFLNDYGHRETTFDYYKPTWAEAPWVVANLIRLVAESGTEDPILQERTIKAHRMECFGRLLEQTPPTLHLFVDELVRLTRQFAWLDDLEHYQTTRMNLMVRKIIFAFGSRFDLDDPLDLFFLTKPELESLTGFALTTEQQENIISRKRSYLEAFQSEPRWNLNDSPEMEPAAGTDTAQFQGVPGSPGVSQGEVYVVRGVEDFAAMPTGAILVARTTNPSWTPLFYKCSGLITESGGPLSHGAVTARELGLPAVMFIRGALQSFTNGETVRIDGSRGMVSRIP